MNKFIKIDSYIFKLDQKSFTKLLLHGGGRYGIKKKHKYSIRFYQIDLF